MSTDGKSSRVDEKGVVGELVCELKVFRKLVRDVGESYILRCEAEIESIISSMENLPRRNVKGVAPRMLTELHNLDLKPRKGRMRDLKDIHRLLKRFVDMIVELQGDGAPAVSRRRRKLPSPEEPASAPIRTSPQDL